jgi:hypothetical protein
MDPTPLQVGLRVGAPPFSLWFFFDRAATSFPWGVTPADVCSTMALSCLLRRVSSAAIVAMFGEYMLVRCVKQTQAAPLHQ